MTEGCYWNNASLKISLPGTLHNKVMRIVDTYFNDVVTNAENNQLQELSILPLYLRVSGANHCKKRQK